MQVQTQGTVFLFTPENAAEKAFFDEEVITEEWQWLGGTCAVDQHFATLLILACQARGFEVSS